MVSWFVKQALVNLAADLGMPAEAPADRAGWAALMQRLGVKGIHIAERDTQRARTPKPRQVFRQHLVGRGLRQRGYAAGRTWLGHVRAVAAGQCARPRFRLRSRDLPAAARRQHPGALLDPDREGAIRLPRHPQRVDLDRGLLPRCATPPARPRTGRLATTRITPATTPCSRCTRCSVRRASASRTGTSSTRTRCLDGIDELGVLLYGRRPQRVLVRLAALRRGDPSHRPPTRNATGLQVTSAVLAGMVYALENPTLGHRGSGRDGFPPLPRDPDAVSRAGDRRIHRLDPRSPVAPACSRTTSTPRSRGRFATSCCGDILRVR